ncbi:MAG: hypothetical protein OXQ29_17385 [Rhodospirillaceae bacterium]|nr:hypothetical protein [Rhodospirillaceae bacterium]
MTRQLKRQRSLHCPPHEREMIRGKAKAACKTLSGYLLDLVQGDDPEIHQLVLSPEEQRELLEGTRTMQAMAVALRRELPGTEGLSLLAAVAVISRWR